MKKPAMRRLATIFLLVLMVAVWTAVGVAWMQRQAISDWWQLRNYTPSAEVVQLTDDTRMTDDARHLFYVYHPQIEPAISFNDHCRIESEFTIVLGCYASGQGIYIFRVEDKRLDGIEEVTAAHEMLHAAYDRLSDDERSRIDGLTAKAYKSVTDERIRQNVNQYRSEDPSTVPNELHSILGTEVRGLPAELEEYYKQYFTDRSVVVSLAERYEKAFSDRKRAIDALAAELERQRAQIDRLTAELDAENQALAAERQALEEDRGNIPPEEFNQRASAYNDRVAAYNQDVASLSRLIDSYNNGVEEYEQLVLERQDLFDAIDSRPEEI